MKRPFQIPIRNSSKVPCLGSGMKWGSELYVELGEGCEIVRSGDILGEVYLNLNVFTLAHVILKWVLNGSAFYSYLLKTCGHRVNKNVSVYYLLEKVFVQLSYRTSHSGVTQCLLELSKGLFALICSTSLSSSSPCFLAACKPIFLILFC